MNNSLSNLLPVLSMVLLASCSNKYGLSTADTLSEIALPVAGAGIGGALAGDDTTDKVLGAAAGALGGAVLGNLAFGDEKLDKAYKAGLKEGYVKGSSDSAKRDYWKLQYQNGLDGEGLLTIREYDIPAGETSDGRIKVPSTIKVPIVE